MRRVIHNLSRRGGFLAALAVALLAAQAVTVAHEIDPADHGPGQACETCLAASHLAGANVAAPVLPPAARLPQAVDVEYLQLLISPAPRDFRARGPPLAT